MSPRRAHRTSIKRHFLKISSTLNDEYPQNGSKNGVTAPRTGSDTARRAFCVSEVGALKFKSSIRLVGTSMSTRVCRYVNANDCWW